MLLPDPAASASDARGTNDLLKNTWVRVTLVVFLFNALWLGRGVVEPGFRNLDVAGIVYNARLFLTGGLPYLDSVEVKPPGAFLLIAPALWVGGLRGVWALAVAWGTLTSLAVGLLSSECYGRRWGTRAAVFHAATSVLMNDADINYTFWMSMPFTASMALAVWASRRRDWVGEGRRAAAWALCGALALLAVSIKPSAATLLVPLALLGLRELAGKGFRAALELAVWGAVGALVTAWIIALPYVAQGRLDALIAGIGGVRAFGNEYLGIVTAGAGGYLAAAQNGIQCLPEQMPASIAFALLGCLPGRLRRDTSPVSWLPWTFLLASLLGVTMTLRFFTHDNAQLGPALCLLTLRPNGLVGRLFEWLEAKGRIRIVRWLPALLGVAVALTGLWSRFWLQYYFVANDRAVAGICERFARYLAPDDSVLAWGWHAWGVYEHCARRAPGPVYKTLGIVTTLNTNTCNRGYGQIALRRGPVTEAFVRDVQRRPPGLFLWSRYHVDMGGDPLADFPELAEFIRARYSVVHSDHLFVAYLRKDRLQSLPGADAAAGLPPWSPNAPPRPEAK